MAETKNILIVEDEPLHVEIYKEKLGNEGFSVVAAKDEFETENALKSMKPDLMLLDVLLPGKSGLEILADMRGMPEYAKLPVIVLTNYDDAATRNRAQRLGVLEYIVKANMTPVDIVHKIKRIFGA